MSMFKLTKTVSIITGASKGIGKSIAEYFAGAGSHVVCVSRSEKSLIKVQNKIINNGGNASIYACDVSILDDVTSLINDTINNFKQIDILINNAGITLPENAEKYSLDSWKKTIDVNLTGSFQISLEVLSYMKKKSKGSIINITSLNAEFGFPDNPAYVASKGGLKLLGKSLARDWGKYGIRVNNLGPGYIKTKMTKKSFENKKTFELRKARTMLDRWGKPDDLLGTCIFLASDASSYVTGQDIYVDGGWSANGLSSK